MNLRRALPLAVALAIVLAATFWRLRGPSPKDAATPAGEFAAARAATVLHDLLREQVPHPVGSAANARIRDRIVDRFRALGYETTVARAFACNAALTCATVENIVALPPGSGPVVLLAAHYDSVPAGMGASDDGVGVAVLLESARAIQKDPRRERIGFLITDGEEAGLLGAEAFAAQTFPRPVAVIVNVEHRGTSGPSYLFETSRGNAALIAAADAALERPFSSSLFYTVYDLMPNDTDVTVFKRAGLQAINFAAIGNVAAYHTPLDNLANVDPRTLQHHGDNALSLARHLAAVDLPAPQMNAVYFDVLGFFVVRWPERWTLWIAIFSLLLLAMAIWRVPGSGGIRGVLLGIAAFLCTILLASVAGFVLVWLAHLRAESSRIAFPQPVIASMWLVGIVSALSMASLPKRRADSRSLLLGAAVAWHLAAIALTLILPGLSFLFLVPALAMSICAIVRAGDLTAAMVAAVIAAILFFPVSMALYTALAKTSLLPTAVLIGIVSATFAAVVEPSRRLIFSLAGLAVAAAIATLFLPTFTSAHPRRLPLTHELPEPTVSVSGTRSGADVRIHVQSQRMVNRVGVTLENGGKVVRINGVAPPPPTARTATWRSNEVVVHGNAAVIEVRNAPQPFEVTAWDLSYGVPAEVAAGRGPNAVTSGRGDVTLSHRKASF